MYSSNFKKKSKILSFYRSLRRSFILVTKNHQTENSRGRGPSFSRICLFFFKCGVLSPSYNVASPWKTRIIYKKRSNNQWAREFQSKFYDKR